MVGIKTAAERNRLAAVCCPTAFSFIFILMTLGFWRTAQYAIYAVLFPGAIFCFFYMFRYWREKAKEKRTAVTLLCALIFDYWLWTAFAQYKSGGSYVFLLLEEGARLACLVLLFRFFCGLGSIARAVHILMLKFFLLDFSVVMLSRGDFVISMGIVHPLYFWPLFALFVVHFASIAFIIAQPDSKIGVTRI